MHMRRDFFQEKLLDTTVARATLSGAERQLYIQILMNEFLRKQSLLQ